MLTKKVIVYPDNSLCLEGKMYSAPQGFFEKYGIPTTRAQLSRSLAKAAEVIRRENIVFVCHLQPQHKGLRNTVASKPTADAGMLPELVF